MRPSSVLTSRSHKLTELSTKITDKPSTSIRKLAQQAQIAKTTAHRGLKKLALHLYRATLVQELNPPDIPRRLQFARWIINFVRVNGIEILNKVLFSDEAWFHRTGYINARNYRIGRAQILTDTKKLTCISRKLVWCTISRRRIVGPIFFTSTIKAETYREMIMQFISLLQVDERDCWFQQDGAPAHISHETLNFLQEFFSERVISVRLWPLRNPDLSSPDYFLRERPLRIFPIDNE